MLRNLSLAMKISGGFALVLLLTLIVGGIAVWNLNEIQFNADRMEDEYIPEVGIANRIERYSLLTMFENRGYGFTENETYLEKGKEHIAEVRTALKEASQLAEQYPALVVLRKEVDETIAAVDAYQKLVDETVGITSEMTTIRNNLDTAAKNYMDNCATFLTGQNEKLMQDTRAGLGADAIQERLNKITWINDVIDEGNATRVDNWKAQARREPEVMKAALKNFAAIDAKLKDIEGITRLQEDLDSLRRIHAAADNYEKAMEHMLEDWTRLQELNSERTEVAETVLANAQETAQAGLTGTQDLALKSGNTIAFASTSLVFAVLFSLGLGVLISYFLTTSITKPVNTVIAGLQSGSDQVASAASQVAGSSQQMAEGASQQASSLEEVSSSLEEMASMTRQTADNAKQANQLATTARDSAEQGNVAMERMSDAIERIKSSADETAKIVKTIDEIAFQTNLLALNAAVEAARAGEAGKGFAVVAEEVRNLAQRSAEAAKNTASLIEESQRNSVDGVQATEQVGSVLHKIVDAAMQVNNLIGEVSAASQEQAQGIDQVTKAVSEMDKVTQANAANAEESSSASEELSAQSRELNEMVVALIDIVQSSKNSQDHGRSIRQITDSKPRSGKKMLHSKGSENRPKKRETKQVESSVMHPESVIPLDDEDLQDF